MRTNRPRNGRLALAVVLNLAVGGMAWTADATASKPLAEPSAPVRHAHLGCSLEQADALYGKPTQQKQLFKGTKEGTKEQRFYKSPRGRSSRFGSARRERRRFCFRGRTAWK